MAFRTAATSHTSSHVRINSAGDKYTDESGNAWCADSGFTGGSKTKGTTVDIAGTSDDELYRKGRYGDFSYNFTLPNGRHSVTLKFAETYWTKPGERVFDVNIEGRPVLDNFDIAEATAPRTAVDKTFDVDVTDGSLDLTFTGVKDNALVSAIEVIPSGTGQ